MGVTLKDLFGHVRKNQAELVVWRRITTFLQNEFISSDAVSARQVLKLDEGGEISEEQVEEVIDIIHRDHIAPMEKRVIHLMDTELDSALDRLRAEKEQSRQQDEAEQDESDPPKISQGKRK
jgi:hypothetical protein